MKQKRLAYSLLYIAANVMFAVSFILDKSMFITASIAVPFMLSGLLLGEWLRRRSKRAQAKMDISVQNILLMLMIFLASVSLSILIRDYIDQPTVESIGIIVANLAAAYANLTILSKVFGKKNQNI